MYASWRDEVRKVDSTMAITIKDVAKKAQVAPSTVSRVIADSPRISEKTKRKVRKVMEELGYHPNINARSLAVKATQTIGLVMARSTSQSMHNPFFPEVIRGISAYCRQKEYSISMTTGETAEEIFQDVVKMVQGSRVDGMLVLYSRKDDRVVQYLKEIDFPFVLIGKPPAENAGITYVDNNNYRAARELTDYLIGLGHEKIAYIGGDVKLTVTQERFNGYSEAMRLANFAVSDDYVKYIAFEREEGKRAVNEIMDLPQPPTALIVADDLVALGVLSALQEKQIKVPEEVSVVSFNNALISELASPPLTTVDINIFQLGFEAAKCVLELVEQPEMMSKHVIVPTAIVKRETCRRRD